MPMTGDYLDDQPARPEPSERDLRDPRIVQGIGSPPGWYLDPSTPETLRWWNGASWEAQTWKLGGFELGAARHRPCRLCGEAARDTKSAWCWFCGTELVLDTGPDTDPEADGTAATDAESTNDAEGPAGT